MEIFKLEKNDSLIIELKMRVIYLLVSRLGIYYNFYRVYLFIFVGGFLMVDL